MYCTQLSLMFEIQNIYSERLLNYHWNIFYETERFVNHIYYPIQFHYLIQMCKIQHWCSLPLLYISWCFVLLTPWQKRCIVISCFSLNAMMTTFDSFVLNLWYYRENYGIYGVNNNRINKGNLMILQKLWYYT